MKISVILRFPKGYIADPYWPAREKAINIEKESGTNRARSMERRQRALQDYLQANGMTLADYQQLKAEASRPFYAEDGYIIIPAHQLYGALAQGAALASRSIAVARPETIRTVLRVSDFTTPKQGPDGVWERFVPVKAGPGNKLSNQRALRSNAYIEDFEAQGELHFSTDILQPQKVKDFLRFVGQEIGVGASRKMDWGRFTIEEWRESNGA
jgi:hypothetical protein